jgi:hypothetical protein
LFFGLCKRLKAHSTQKRDKKHTSSFSEEAHKLYYISCWGKKKVLIGIKIKFSKDRKIYLLHKKSKLLYSKGFVNKDSGPTDWSLWHTPNKWKKKIWKLLFPHPTFKLNQN